MATEHHSTNDVRYALRSFAHDTWEQHAKDVDDSHKWLQTFIHTVTRAGAQRTKGSSRPVISELMKTPGRKRVVANVTNAASTNSNRVVEKPPCATLLFPAPPIRAVTQEVDKENTTVLSPGFKYLSPATKGKARGVSPSPIRLDSPRRALAPFGMTRSTGGVLSKEVRAGSPAPRSISKVERVVSPSKADVSADLSLINAAQLASAFEDAAEAEANGIVAVGGIEGGTEEGGEALENGPSAVTEEDKANLSIIGEEEEDDESLRRSFSSVSTVPNKSPKKSPLVVETQLSSAAASPIAEQEDPLPLTTAVDTAAASSPLDLPSSSFTSLASSTAVAEDATLVPLNDAPSSYRNTAPSSSSTTPSSRTPGTGPRFGAKSGGIGSSSPPPAWGSLSVGAAKSASGRPTLNFVGMARRRSGTSYGGANEGPSQSSQPPSTTPGPAPKRKSLSGPDVPNKLPRTEAAVVSTTEGDASKARREALASRLQNMGAGRNSVAPRVSNTVGVGSLLVNKLAQSTNGPFAPIVDAAPPLPPKSTTTSTGFMPTKASIPTPIVSAALSKPILARRTSVTELVKTFEATHSRPPSPIKPSYLLSTSTLGTVRSPILSPASPRRVISRIASPPASAPRMALRSPPRVPVVAKSPTRVAKIAAPFVSLSTTPQGSPSSTAARSILQQLARSPPVAPVEVQEEEEMDIREVVRLSDARTSSGSAPDDSEEGLVALPSPLPAEDEEEMDADDESVVELLVEKGRGALVSAMEAVVVEKARIVVGKASPSKIVMPGTFGMQETEEEEGDESIEIIDPKTLVRTPSLLLSSGVLMRGIQQTKPLMVKKTSQSSLASSSQSSSSGVISFFSKPFGGGSKKGDLQVKSIAAARANKKKEDQEKERKAALKEERMAALMKRQEDERVKQEEERKVKADGAERKRKERDEASGTSSQTSSVVKTKIVRPKAKEDEPIKKRKIEPEVKRAEVKKPVAPRPISVAPLAKSSSSMAPPTMPLKSSLASSKNAPSGLPARVPNYNAPPTKPFPLHASQLPPVASGSRPPPARVEPEPYQELPDIDSEYSDSGDENHDAKDKLNEPWARSPAVAQALKRQQHINPDDIFGPIPPLSMQEIFRTNSTRITKRTSSACWEGTDALTEADMARYNRQMGFTKGRPSHLSRQ